MDAPDTSAFTPAETKLLVEILRYCDGTIVTDWNRVAEAMNYKDSGVAKQRFQQIRKKKMGGAAAGGSAKTSPTKATPTKRGSKDMADSGTEATPKKRGRKGKKVEEVDAETKSEDVEDEAGAGGSKEEQADEDESKVKAEMTE